MNFHALFPEKKKYFKYICFILNGVQCYALINVFPQWRVGDYPGELDNFENRLSYSLSRSHKFVLKSP